MRAYSQNGSPCGVMPQRPSLSTHLKAEPVIANEGIQLRKGAIKKTSASDCMEEYITVRQFLETCVPAMDHLLMSFIQFGCTTEEYLRSFAAFGLKKRRQVLESIFAGYLAADGNENNRGATEMDLAVLEDHLDRYFL
ncbi:hypothetical protein CPB84DRAFT_1789582 [Gymnopilus junonius]|uniref:Uncharacterized protein n=1 Tax=Gymnopilus junonius TaxID=109634 RepID=A0A9P5NGK8_GYMJU|nr:hypothetical protein CPB84DRAFT_1789582 [Gymnopilus junonius]